MSLPQGRLRILLVFLLLSAVWAFWPKRDATPDSGAPRAEKGRAGRRADVSDWDVIPSLDLASKEAVPEKVERNIFRFFDKPTPTPTRVPVPPTPVPLTSFPGPWPQTPTPTATPIVPPQIPFTAIGRFGQPERPIVVLETGGKLINAREGDVVETRFQIRKINRESIDIGFTELPHDITRRLPITGMDR